jgi:hypothetical protein
LGFPNEFLSASLISAAATRLDGLIHGFVNIYEANARLFPRPPEWTCRGPDRMLTRFRIPAALSIQSQQFRSQDAHRDQYRFDHALVLRRRDPAHG